MARDGDVGVSLPVTIATGRLTLTRITSDVCDTLAEIMWSERAQLSPWIELGGDPAALAVKLRTLATDSILYVASADAIVGCFSLHPIVEQAAATIAYWLRGEYSGHGFATEAVAALVEMGVRAFERFEIWCAPDNVRSGGVACRVGFTLATVADDPPRQRWTIDRGTIIARAAIHAACNGVARMTIDRDGNLFADSARVTTHVVGGRTFIVAVCDVAADATFTERDCLVHNTTLAVGALGIASDRIILRYATLPEAFTGDTLALFLHEAGRLGALTNRPDATDVLLSDYYTD